MDHTAQNLRGLSSSGPSNECSRSLNFREITLYSLAKSILKNELDTTSKLDRLQRVIEKCFQVSPTPLMILRRFVK